MAPLILCVLAVEKSMRARRHGYHALWAAGKLLKCAQQAGAVGWLSW